MKKIIFLILILSACCRTALATVPLAQASGAHNGCDIVITGSFDSECVYDYKDAITDEYPDLMIACKQSIVTYTAWTTTGSATVTSCTWEVYGDVTHSASGNQVTVTWGDDDWGVVVVTVTTTAGDTCTESSRVRLIDKPTASSVTVPAYTVLPNGRKVVRVCEGGTVQFIDQSASAGSDLAGHHWECKQRSPSSTPNYTIENVTMNDFVQHRVYNNCGCYDEEEIEIEVVTGVPLELECYGAVCEDAIVEYHVVSPACHTYQWYVEGGTLIDGRGTDRPVVQWDHAEGGYGVIGLDGVLCDDQACPTLTSLTVPVIQDSLAIEGPSEACLGEAVVYRLPLLGSTKYSWSITPTTGVDTSMKTSGNELRLVFNQPGVYELRCSYRCDFLDCGPYAAQPLTIRVKPVLSIAGDDHICLTNACHLATAPAVAADWTVYDLGAGNQVAATATGSSTFVHTFSDTGRYLVTAVHDSFCGPATFVLTVNDVPAAPTAGDLAPGNRHVACPWQGVTLRGTPAEPRYSLVWMPVDTTALPRQHSGDSVAVSYQGAVCDVRVYHYDRQQQCLSTGYYVHQMAPLVPAPLNIPTHLTVCPGSLLVWGSDNVPDQSADGMLYEWKIQPDRQSCASVQGSHLTPGIALAVNNIPTPATFYVELVRSFCGGSVSDYIYLHVVDTLPGCKRTTRADTTANKRCKGSGKEEVAVTITSANAANINHTCDNTPIQLTATLNYASQIVSSNWTFGDGSSYETSGNSVYHTFAYPPAPYTVSVTITDTNKCTKTSKVPLIVISHLNDLDNTGLYYQQPFICPNASGSKDIIYTGGSNTHDYYWYAPHSAEPQHNHSYIYPTYYQGDYKLYVENTYYCKKERSEYVKFLSSPTAGIYAERFTCCVGDKLKLYGQQGPDGEPLDYRWTVSDPAGNIQTYTTPNIVFTAPNNPGAYTVTLTVTNTRTTCSNTTTETVTVTTPPAATSE